LIEHPPFLVGRWPHMLAGFLDRFGFGCFALSVVRVVLFRLRDGSTENSIIQFLPVALAGGPSLYGRDMPFEGGCEGCRG
jgi:hypothetical protein